MQPVTGIHWYRHDLRLHDNIGLNKCLDKVERFVPIFIFDGETAGTDICGYIRFRFLIQALKDLEQQFKALNINFMCFYGKPHDIIENLIDEWNVKVVSFSKDTESRKNKRDECVRKACTSKFVQIFECDTHTLYDTRKISNMNEGGMAVTLDEFKKFCHRIGQPDRPVNMPDFKNTCLFKTCNLYTENLHKVPDLEHFKIKRECIEQINCKYPGGETKALELYERRIELEKKSFENGIVNPNSIKPILFTEEISLSPYLRFGCLSSKKLYWGIAEKFNKVYKGNKTLIDATEMLFWREYFYQLCYKNCHFYQIDKNPGTFKIPWEWNKMMFEKWENGQTGFPWIDASMRQLKQEGWIHHICRNSLAIFLTRGDMFHSWERGSLTFLKYQIDADASICAGNWNYISSGDPEALVDPSNNFCPVKNGKKIDPEGQFIRKYVPELNDFPNEFLHDPWKAPLVVQEEAGCIIGKDYPEPILDHDQSFIENIDKLKQFFQTSKYSLYNTNASEDYKNFTWSKYLENEFDDF